MSECVYLHLRLKEQKYFISAFFYPIINILACYRYHKENRSGLSLHSGDLLIRTRLFVFAPKAAPVRSSRARLLRKHEWYQREIHLCESLQTRLKYLKWVEALSHSRMCQELYHFSMRTKYANQYYTQSEAQQGLINYK